ncbi:hypothetical protein QBC40DRAFT_332534 [Triangularia verruculosa]|uniref:Zn(2)-C6 fungal-type domain-containing protein n=1 Tax=Triangularia verruculosa TaxID=2587418 RepID=A0AAN6XPY9_9PEZI|nr:hypothetical protein QBC40DRAFT_332534 [Triangularia verruculosa]
MPLPGFPFAQNWGFPSLNTSAPVPEPEAVDTSPSTLANSSPENNTGQTSPQATSPRSLANDGVGSSNVVIIDPNSDDDDVVDISKAIRQKGSLSKPSVPKASSVPPPPGSLAAEAQARPVPKTLVKKGLGWLESGPNPPAGGIETVKDTPIQTPDSTPAGSSEGVPPRTVTFSEAPQRECRKTKDTEEEKKRRREKTLKDLAKLERRPVKVPKAFDDGRGQGSLAASSGGSVVDLRSPPSASKAGSIAGSVSSRKSRRKREEKRRRKELKKAAQAAGSSIAQDVPDRRLDSQQDRQPRHQPGPAQQSRRESHQTRALTQPATYQTAESRVVDREISKAIRHTPITAREKAEKRLREVKERGAQAYQRGSNRGALTVESVEEIGIRGADEAISVLEKRLAEAEARKPRTQVVSGLDSGDIQQNPRPSASRPGQAVASAAAIGPSGRRRKCDRCIRMKRPCSYEQPCSRCQAAGVRCVYFSSDARPRQVERPPYQTAVPGSSAQAESFVDQQYGLSVPQPGFREPSSPEQQPTIQYRPRPPRSPSYSPSPEPESSPVDTVSAMDAFGPNQMVQQYVVYRTQKLPVVENEDPEETRMDYAIRCSEHSKLAHANQQAMARMNKPKRGVVGRSWKYRPGLEEGQVPGLADARVEYGSKEVEFVWVEIETRDLLAVVNLRGGEKAGELRVERKATEVYVKRRYDVWSVVVVKREDPLAKQVEKRVVFECGGVEDKGVQTDEMEVEVEVDAEIEEEAEAAEDIDIMNEAKGTEELPVETVGDSQLTDTTQAEMQHPTETSPKEDLPWWHPDYYADSDDDSGEEDEEDDASLTDALPPYVAPAPVILPQGSNALDLLSITTTYHSSYSRPHLANVQALRVFLSLTEPKNNYMNDNIHYYSVLKPTQEFHFEEAGLENSMTRQLFNVTWRPPGNTPTESYKWEFEEVRVWVKETVLQGPIDLSDYVTQDGEQGGYFVNKGKKKDVGRSADLNGKGKAVEDKGREEGVGVFEEEGDASEEE